MKEDKARNKLSIVLNVISTIVLVISILICVLIIFSLKSSSGVAQIFGHTVFSVQSDSMEPVFYKGDLIVVRCSEPAERFKKGDIVSFFTYDKIGTRFVNTHRIVEVQEDTTRDRYITKGDNAPEPDDKKLISSGILGVYTGQRVAGLGKVIDFINSPTGVLLCVVIPSAIIIIAQAVSYGTNSSRKKKEMLLAAEERARQERIQLVNDVVAAQRGQVVGGYPIPNVGDIGAVQMEDADKQRVIQEFLSRQAQEEAKKQAIIEEYLQKQKEAEQAAKEEAEAAKIKAIIAEFLAQQKAGDTTDAPGSPSDSEEKQG